MFFLAVGAVLAVILMLLKWCLTTLLPRPGAVAVDRAFAAAGGVFQKMTALMLLILLAGLAFIMLVPPPH